MEVLVNVCEMYRVWFRLPIASVLAYVFVLHRFADAVEELWRPSGTVTIGDHLRR